MKKKRYGLDASHTIFQLARSPMLDDLSGQELVVYLRLLSEVETQRARRFKVENLKLHSKRGGRTAAAALETLEKEHRLIRIRNPGTNKRTIEVLA